MKGIRCGSIQVIFNGRILDGGIQEKKNEGEKGREGRRGKKHRCKVLTAVFGAVRLWGQVPMNTHTNKCSHGTHILAVPC